MYTGLLKPLCLNVLCGEQYLVSCWNALAHNSCFLSEHFSLLNEYFPVFKKSSLPVGFNLAFKIYHFVPLVSPCFSDERSFPLLLKESSAQQHPGQPLISFLSSFSELSFQLLTKSVPLHFPLGQIKIVLFLEPSGQAMVTVEPLPIKGRKKQQQEASRPRPRYKVVSGQP